MSRMVLVASLLVSASSVAASRIGVVVVSKEGLTEEKADDLAYDLAAAVATQIEGEAIAGQSVRNLLPPGGPTEGCEEQPGCGRELAATLKVDEVLLLVMRVAGKTTVVNCHRVPRDATKPPTDRPLRLFGNKAKRVQAVMELVTALYPSGSVEPFVWTPPPAPVKEPGTAPPAVQEKGREQPVEKGPSRKWLWVGVGAGAGVAAVVLAIVLGVTLTPPAAPTGPAITLPLNLP